MSRSVKDSDDDYEPKPSIGRMQTRMLTVQSVNSPLRRSSRIKQNKCSPGSESDSSISSTQTTRSARTRTTMDSTVSDTTKKLRTRKHSISSEISEIDIDVISQTPVKRTTRQSLGATSLVSTPTRVNTRATSKRFMRAGSETKSPLPATRLTRTTRARSIDPESLTENKNQSSSPIKTRRRTSVLPSSSQIKEQIEPNDRILYVRLDSTIVETDEITNSGNSDSSPDKQLQRLHQIKRKLQNVVKDKVEEDYSHENVETSIDLSKSDETLQLSEKKDAIQIEDITRETGKNIENTLDKEQKKFEETPPSDKSIIEEFSSYSSPNHRNSAKEDTKIVENLSDIEKSLLDICGSNKEMEVMPENLSGTSLEEEKSNKENQMLNIISDVAEKLVQPKPASSIKSFTSSFMGELLSEKETKSMKKEVHLNKSLRSRESTEVAIKYSNLSEETIDNSQEKMDISIESRNSSASDKIILLHESIEVVDKVTNKDEISTENISAYNENATEIINELEKTDTKECTITNNKNSNKSESNEVDKTSRLSINLVKSKQTSDSRENLTSILITDDNEIKLVLEEQSCNDNEVSPNVVHSKLDQLVDLQISSPINKTSTDSATVIDKQSALTQDKIIVIDSFDSIEQEEENLLKQETESISQSSIIVLETNNSASNDSNIVIQNNQLTDVIEASKKSTMDISFEKTVSKDVLSEKVKSNLKRKSTDNLEGEKESLQMERTQKDRENVNVVDDVSDVNAGINLFQDIPADKWKEKDDVKTDSVQSTSQLVEEVEKENEAEYDLILVDKQAWLAAETIKAAKEAESFEYDSDDTVLLKSRLDSLTSQPNYDIEQLATVDEELTLDIDANEKNEKQIKKRKSRTKKRLVSEIDEDISRYTEDENLIPVDKSLNESKIALNRTNDQSRLNKSEQSEKTKRRSSKTNNELEKEIEDDANELNRSSLISKNNISLQKSTGKRISLNKSSKDISMQNISPNKSQTDNSEKELDDTTASTRKKLYKKKRSLEQSCNEDADDNAIESEKKNVATEDCSKKHENTSLNHSTDQESESIDTRKIVHLNESDDSDIDVSIVAMDLGSKTSMIANMGSDSECEIPRYLFTKANSGSNTDDSNGYSDSLNREYNLDGLELKFSDDDVAADECRDSEVEFSDSDDNGSDLEDFIVDDIEIENDDEEDSDTEAENEEEENDEDNDIETENDEEDNNIESENDEKDNDTEEENAEEDNDIEAENDDKEDNEDDNAVQKEKMEDEKEKANFNMELNIENKDNEDIQKKDIADKDTNQNKFIEMEAVTLYASTSHKLPKIHENNNKSIEHISPCRSETETKHKNDIKMKKSNMKKNEKSILQDSSNSDLSIKKKKKKKSPVKENETIPLDMCNIISSSHKSILDPQCPKDRAEQHLSEKLNEFKSTFAKLSESHALMEFSTPDLNSKKLEFDKTFERIPENKANKSNNTINTTQNISVKDKSKKDLTLNKDSSKKFKDASKKKISSDLSLLSDLLKKVEGLTNPLKSPKIASRKTMNIDIETPRLKYLRKEKLNESAPTKLEYSTETNSLQKQLSAKKDTTQIRIKEKNKDKIHDLIIPSNDDVIQCSQKKQKKRKRQDSANKNISDEVLSENVTELNVPKKKKLKLIPLTVVEDNIHKDICETNKKKKKKDKLKENITGKAKNAIELNVSKKKKPVKLTQLPTVEDNTLEDISLLHSEKKLKQSILMKYIIREVWSKDITKLRPKKKEYDKFTQLPVVEDNIREDVSQINERKKKKKKQDTSKENVIDKSLSTDVIEIKIPKKKKRAKLAQLSIVEDAIEEACQIDKIKKKKKQINIVEENTNVNKDMLRNIRENKTELLQHKKKNKVINSLELDLLTDKQEQQVKKKIKRQETVESIETLQTEKKKKKKKKKKEEEDTLLIQIPVSKKSEKILPSKSRLQKTALGMSKLKNIAYNTKELDETDAKVCTEESRSKKKRNRSEDVENAICMNIPRKSKKEIKEKKFLLPSSGLKRLADDVIENLADVPTKAKKRQKTSRDKEKMVSTTTGKVKVMTTDRDNTLNTPDCTTQFHVVNLQKTKKQPLKGAAAAVSFRERMLTRNNREPMSSYLMFCEKMSHPK